MLQENKYLKINVCHLKKSQQMNSHVHCTEKHIKMNKQDSLSWNLNETCYLPNKWIQEPRDTPAPYRSPSAGASSSTPPK